MTLLAPGACPPLPKITKWPATLEQKRAADAHFKCKMHPGGPLSPAKLKSIWLAAGQWVTAQEAAVFGKRYNERGERLTVGHPSQAHLTLKHDKPKVVPGPTLPPPSTLAPLVQPTTQLAPSKPPGGRTSMALGTLVGVGTALLPLVGRGKSKCPGPYNYDPQTGGCVPKPDFAARTGMGGGGQSLVATGGGMILTSGGECQPGFRWDGKRCVQEGARGFIERLLPGGETGTQADIYGEAVVGSFGMPALVPAQVGQVMNTRGEVSPIRRCPKGAVLGKDNLCYQKGAISRQYRKWPKASTPKGYISKGDLKALNRIHSLQEKAKNLAMASGFKVTKRR